MFIVFDLDGTLALNEHRQHFVQRPKGEKDWDAFFEACDQDSTYWQVMEVMRSLIIAGHRVEIWSGRSAQVIEKTHAWLGRYGFAYLLTRSRPAGNHIPDTELKTEWLVQASPKPDLVFDDRDSVVAMWRANGIPCCQVAPGNF